MRPLAIIESDRKIAAELQSTFDSAGIRVELFAEGSAALAVVRTRPYALALLDLDIHDTDPFAVCRLMSAVVPVITMSSACSHDACVRALEAGADDCVIRPMAGRELIARVRNVLRRVETTRYSCDSADLSISLEEMRVRRGDTVYELSRGEADVLALLLQHAPTPLTALDIANILSAKRGTVESRIKSLRKKLGPEKIVTRGRFGYEVV